MSEGDLQLERLLGLIDYVEATERDRLKIAFDFRQHGGFCKVEIDFKGLPGTELNYGDEDDPVWLRVQRLAKIAPPPPADPSLGLWVSIRDDVESTPTLRSEIPVAGLIDLGNEFPDDAPETVFLEGFAGREELEADFADWLAGPWAEWRERETPRRATIKLYNELYMLRQQLEGVSDVPMELVCGVGVATLQRASHRLRYPLLTMAMELSLEPLSHAIVARPRLEAYPTIEIDPLDRMELHSLDTWRSAAEQGLSALEGSALSPFDPSTFETILRHAAALLVPDGIYVPDAMPEQASEIPAIEQILQVSRAFCFFQRERRATQLMEDLRRFRAGLQEDESREFPDAVTALLVNPGEVAEDPVYPQFRGVSTIPGVTSSDGGGRDLFFPKAFNREQVEVVQRLEERPGVVVQGPPGTGKTHTIANIISHYLALGKRVLVTSQKAPALRVLRDKLPAAVRPLAVSLLDSDRDGLKQFQESVDIIAEKLQRLRRRDLENEISDLDHQIDSLHRELASIDHEIDAIGRRAIAPATIGGITIEPVRAARMVVAEAEIADWISDPIDADPIFDHQFTADDVVALRQARRRIGDDLEYVGKRIPSSSALPSLDQMLATHRDLSRAAELRREVGRGALADLRDSGASPQDALEALSGEINELQTQEAEAERTSCSWSDEAVRQIRAGRDVEWRAGLEELRPEVDRLAGEAAYFLTRPVTLPCDALENDRFLEAAQRLAEGKAAIGLVGGLFAGRLKARLAEVRARGDAVRDADGWQLVVRHIDALMASARLRQVWNHFVAHSIGDTVDEAGLGVAKSIQHQLRHLAALYALVEQQALVDQGAQRLFLPPMGPMSNGPAAVRVLADNVNAHLLKFRLERAETIRASLLSKFGECEGEICAKLSSMCIGKLGNPDIKADEFSEGWQDLVRRLAEIEGWADAFETVQKVTAAVVKSGAPVWAERLRKEAVDGTEDNLLPGDWDRRWLLKRLTLWLGQIDQHSRLRELGRDRIEKEGLLNLAYERSIELRTWLQLSLKATDSVKAALAAYADAIRRIGKGTGKRVGRYRREARAASDRAKGALPCWIMPHYRVSESLPAELGLFDLVIVDEASQSTLSALPALLRAEKILIVGMTSRSAQNRSGGTRRGRTSWWDATSVAKSQTTARHCGRKSRSTTLGRWCSPAGRLC